MLEILRRPDVTTYYAIQVQGIPELWVQVGEGRNLFGGVAAKAVIPPQSVVLSYPKLEPLKGLGTPGSLSVELVETGGYFAAMLSTGASTYLTEDVSFSDSTIHVADTSAFPATGTICIHQETISYTGKTGTTFTGCSRSVHDSLDVAREHSTVALLGASVGAVSQPKIRVTRYPRSMLGRWVSVRVACLDPCGYPIVDEEGRENWELWRGIITGFPRAPDGISYGMKAETLERSIPDKVPTCGVSGKLDVRNATKSQIVPNGASHNFEVYENQEFFFGANRNAIVIGLCIGDGGEGLETVVNVPALGSFTDSGWLTLQQVEAGIKAALDSATTSSWVVRLLNRVEDGVFELQLRCPDWQWEHGGDISVSLLPSESSIWGQLGFIGEHRRTKFCNTGQDRLFWYQGNVAPSSVDIRESETELPLVLTGLSRGGENGGWVKVGDEVLSYESIAWHTGASPDCGWDTRAILTGCVRGVGGTQAGVYRYPKDETADPPEVSPAYAIDGDQNVWVSLCRTLTGTGGTAYNLFDTGTSTFSYWTDNGLGISCKHFDSVALAKLIYSNARLTPLTGCPTGLRGWLSDALALEGVALVTRPGDDGLCLLRPVRLGGANPGETALIVTLDSTGRVDVTDGLSAIRNQVTYKDLAGRKTDYNNVDSQETFRVVQGVSFEAPTASLGTFPALVPVSYRLFNLLGEGYAELEATLSPAGSRFLAPGDVCLIELPNASYTGLWRILSASTPLRGKGTVKISAIKVDFWAAYQYAPTGQIVTWDSENGSMELRSGEGQWFKQGAELRIFDAGNYLGGVTATVVSRSGDTLTLSDLTGEISEGNKVEFETYSTSNNEGRYLWLDQGCTWGD